MAAPSPSLEQRVAAALGDFLDEQARRLEPLGADAARLLAEARTAVSGGKRLRASFCYWGHRAVPGAADGDGADDDAVVRAAASLELLHASALVHDDLMDASDTRRGRPATHRLLEAEHRTAGWRGDPEQYGEAAAVLLGDLLLSWSDEMLRRCGLPAEVVGEALGVLDLTRSEVIAGQFLDVSVQARGHADVDTAMRVLRWKSARYSVERPLLLGAALAGGSPATARALGAFGLPLGEAFQLRDDLLGVFGDPATTGKPAGDDLVEGKRTVLVALTLDAAPAAQAAELDALLGHDLAPEQVARLRSVIEDSGAREQVEEAIAALTATALGALGRAEEDALVAAPAAERLRALADAATRRTS